MVNPGTWFDLSAYGVPAVNTTQLAVNEVSRLIRLSDQLRENERASFKIETTHTNDDQAETFSVSVNCGKKFQEITYRRTTT
jgi:hypothetical protein